MATSDWAYSRPIPFVTGCPPGNATGRLCRGIQLMKPVPGDFARPPSHPGYAPCPLDKTTRRARKRLIMRPLGDHAMPKNEDTAVRQVVWQLRIPETIVELYFRY